jgi:hypothetical protein
MYIKYSYELQIITANLFLCIISITFQLAPVLIFFYDISEICLNLIYFLK